MKIPISKDYGKFLHIISVHSAHMPNDKECSLYTVIIMHNAFIL
jgi:hypothetical protein